MLSSIFIPLLRAIFYHATSYVVYGFFQKCRLSIRRQTLSPPFQLKVESSLDKHIQVASKKTGNLSILTAYSFFPIILNDQLELLYKIRAPKFRECGTNCLGQISYFLFYRSCGTFGIMSHHFMTRVHHRSLSRGFNVTTHC